MIGDFLLVVLLYSSMSGKEAPTPVANNKTTLETGLVKKVSVAINPSSTTAILKSLCDRVSTFFTSLNFCSYCNIQKGQIPFSTWLYKKGTQYNYKLC